MFDCQKHPPELFRKIRGVQHEFQSIEESIRDLLYPGVVDQRLRVLCGYAFQVSNGAQRATATIAALRRLARIYLFKDRERAALGGTKLLTQIRP